MDDHASVRFYALLADITLSLHVIFVLFVIGGQLLVVLGWRRRWHWVREPGFRIPHLAAIGFVVLESWFGVVCPLTRLEHHLRQRAGLAGYDLSFIGYWLRHLLFYDAPEWLFTIVYTVFGLLVLITFCVYPPRWQNSLRG